MSDPTKRPEEDERADQPEGLDIQEIPVVDTDGVVGNGGFGVADGDPMGAVFGGEIPAAPAELTPEPETLAE